MRDLARLVGIALAAAVAVTAADAPALRRESRRLMGTLFEIQAYEGDEARFARAAGLAFDEMARVDRLLTNYDPASELSRMNRLAPRGPAHVPVELYAFVRESRDYYDATLHAFDPTVGPLVRAWGFFTSHPAQPDAAAIERAKGQSGFDKVRLDNESRTVSYTVAGLEFDPGGIGKGYAVDHAIAILRDEGLTSALVSAGGSTLYAIGRTPEHDGWRVAIKNPLNPEKPFGYVLLRDASLSTSGVSEKSVVAGTHRYAHIFDPRTGEPMEGMCQATVVAPTATQSDALSKPAFILSEDDVTRVIRRFRDVHALRVEGECGEKAVIWKTPWSEGVFQ